MIINNAALQTAAKGFRALFLASLAIATVTWTNIATAVESNSSEETYAWLAELPQVREWIGDRQVKNLEGASYTIRNRKWELTIGVTREEIEDDKLGVVKPRVQDIAQQMASHPDDLLAEVMLDGFDHECFDGQYFFDTDHPVNGQSQSNTGTAPLSAESYGAARANLAARLGANGKSMKIKGTHLVVPPQLEDVAKIILMSEQIEGSTNIYRNSAQLVVYPELSSNPTAWFLLDCSKPVRPFIVQQREKPEFVACENTQDSQVFMKDKFLYGARARHNVGYGLWQMAYGSTGADQA
jgi:phage major head subunit gpT-like protein